MKTKFITDDRVTAKRFLRYCQLGGAGELIEARDRPRTAEGLDENTALEQETRSFGFDSNWSYHSQMLHVT